MARRLVTDMRGEEAGPEDRGLGALVQSEMAESGELGPRGQEPRGEGTQGREDTPDMDSTPLLKIMSTSASDDMIDMRRLRRKNLTKGFSHKMN